MSLEDLNKELGYPGQNALYLAAKNRGSRLRAMRCGGLCCPMIPSSCLVRPCPLKAR